MIRRLRVLLLLATVASAAGLSACDWFRPAQPEAPSGEIAFIPDYSTPDSTLATIAKAIAIKGPGATAYLGAFAESVTAASPAAYHQFFSDEDIAYWITHDHSHVPDWGFPEEQIFYGRFVGQVPLDYHMEWAKDVLNPDIESEGTFYRHYVITTLGADGNTAGYLAIGFAKLKIVQFSDGSWRIVRWDDRVDPNADPNNPEQVTLGRRRLTTTQQ